LLNLFSRHLAWCLWDWSAFADFFYFSWFLRLLSDMFVWYICRTYLSDMFVWHVCLSHLGCLWYLIVFRYSVFKVRFFRLSAIFMASSRLPAPVLWQSFR